MTKKPEQKDGDEGGVNDEDISHEMRKYLEKKDKTNLPEYIDSRCLLQFDANFETGNLDSVYLAKH